MTENNGPVEVWTVGNIERVNVVPLAELPADAAAEFDYVDEEETYSPRFIHYRGEWWDLNDGFMRITTNPTAHRGMWDVYLPGDHGLAHWGAIQTQSHSDAIVIHNWDAEDDRVTVGYAHTTHTGGQFNVAAHVFNCTGEFVSSSVCVDCVIGIANGDWPEMDDNWTQEREDNANATWKEYADITLGHLHGYGPWAEHDCFHAPEPCEDDCDCERTEFARTDCAMCGTHLAGEREDVTMIGRDVYEKYGRAL